jgi:O-antigen ligase
MLAGVGVVLALHLSGSEREPWPVRVLASALAPVAAVTVYFTLSRGGIAASIVGLVAYLLLGFSRATPGALLALVPPCVVAVARAYDADLLVTEEFAGPAGLAEGRDVAVLVLVAAGAAVWLRALALLIDRLLSGLPGPGVLPRRRRAALAGAAVAVALIAALIAGIPGWAERQADAFLSSAPVDTGPDVRDRLMVVNNNGRVQHWGVSLDSWRDAPLRGSGAGTYQNEWNRERPNPGQVLDAHSLYLETLGELGVVGLGLLVAALLAIAAGLVARLRGPDRPTVAAVLAATLVWLVHAGVDWDWELAAVTVWVFGLAGIALAPMRPPEGPPRPFPRLLRLVVALGCLGLALSPAARWRSQVRLAEARTAFDAGDCRGAIDAALDSLGAIRARAEPWELIAYCDARLGQKALAIGAAEAAVRRDPGDWEYHYALAVVRGAFREDPRPAAAEALRLNPLQPEARAAVRVFRTPRPELWERRARKLPLFLQ